MRRPLALALLGLIAFVPAAAEPRRHLSCQAGDIIIDVVDFQLQNGTQTASPACRAERPGGDPNA
jgi:hypothetical protein